MTLVLPPGSTIVFDLDGTLVDTAPDLIGALNVVLGECGLPHLPNEAARSLVGRGARVLIARGFAAAGEPLEDARIPGLTTRFIEVYRSRIASESRPFDGCEAALDRLAEAGARLAVCTNKPTDLAVLLLDALGLSHRFAAVVGPERAPAAKPDPRHYLAAVEQAGGEAGLSLMVGDSSADVGAAQAAGAPCIVVPFGYTEVPAAELGAEAVVQRFVDLPEAAAGLLSALPAARRSVIAAASRTTGQDA